MNAYMTNGTYEFLEKLKEKQTISPFLLIHNGVKTIAYYEDTHLSIFESSRNYQILAQIGHLAEVGFMSMSHLPVTEEGQPIFEMDFKQKVKEMDTVDGVIGARILQPQQGHTYILLVEWQEQKDYQAWKSSEPLPNKKNASYISGDIYTETFEVGEEE
ncbi:hypothetical protein JCM21714_2759 [Gracilibacillus boraciitolerans JCM 21714]|uniref:ABM domain-containing protein n=1 Tax=Gracilibacillus boraciitolerans JCM 21714 TaxID=1298598 RepID=W4VKC0_9BACI|nr:antibiotic biosynthesis monooxygenase [Gracilibacillus boraciitolerans]GAE93657.1 hypothetical protein JCM21714_2759 [Gracilibacillus boraciitolerans JCM 21714]